MLFRRAAPIALLGPFATFASANADVIAQSTFDRGSDGWVLEVSTTWIETLGNPGGCLYGSVEEPTNTTSYAYAPAAFLGSWTALDGIAQVRFDYRRFSNGGGSVLEIIPLNIRIEGGTENPSGVATWTGPQIPLPGPWETYLAPISAADWTVSSGTWEDILSNVTELRIQLELVSNTAEPEDKNGIDNVVLETTCGSALGDLDADCDVDASDLAVLLGSWGSAGGPADLDGDGTVGAADLALLLGAWTG